MVFDLHAKFCSGDISYTRNRGSWKLVIYAIHAEDHATEDHASGELKLSFQLQIKF